MNSEIIAFYIGLKNDLYYWVLKSPKMEGTIDDILINGFYKVNPTEESMTINFKYLKHDHYLKALMKSQGIIQMLLSLEL
jgi:hypothetical protein